MFKWLKGILSNNAAPGSVLVGPTYRSQHNIYMTSDPIIQAAKRSTVLHQEALAHIDALRIDRAKECIQASLEILNQGLPPQQASLVTYEEPLSS